MNADQIIYYLRLFFEIIGIFTTMSAIVAGAITFLGWTAGISLVMKRLGLGRWYRKVTIVSNEKCGKLLEKDLRDSGVFREKNINLIGEDSVADVKEADLILLDYWSIEPDKAQRVIDNKSKHAGLVVYSPMKKERLPFKVTERINEEPFTTLVQMRGRLVNDLLITLMSTSYDKKRR